MNDDDAIYHVGDDIKTIAGQEYAQAPHEDRLYLRLKQLYDNMVRTMHTSNSVLEKSPRVEQLNTKSEDVCATVKIGNECVSYTKNGKGELEIEPSNRLLNRFENIYVSSPVCDDHLNSTSSNDNYGDDKPSEESEIYQSINDIEQYNEGDSNELINSNEKKPTDEPTVIYSTAMKKMNHQQNNSTTQLLNNKNPNQA